MYFLTSFGMARLFVEFLKTSMYRHSEGLVSPKYRMIRMI